MIFLLAESKTMSSVQTDISPECFDSHKPSLENSADSIMEYVRRFSAPQLASVMGVSHNLAVNALKFAYDFPNKTSGYQAIEAFTGEAFRAFDVNSLTEDQRNFLKPNLRIISSAYGILRPDDIVKPYRLEYNKPVAGENMTPVKFFKSKVTIELVNYLKASGIKEIVNLLPGDADACLDWKLIKAFAKVYKICFLSFDKHGNLKTPHSGKIKELRGSMARFISIHNITDFNSLKSTESDKFIYSAADSKPGLPVFIG